MADEQNNGAGAAGGAAGAGAGDAAAAAASGAGAGAAAGQAGGEGQAGNEGAKAVVGAPGKYADFKVPDGVTADAALLGRLGALARELNLPQEQAQQLVDIHYRDSKAAAEAAAKGLQDARTRWLDELKADADFGGERFEANTGLVAKAVQRFGSDAFRQLMDETGLGDHPAVVKVFHQIGKAIDEDKFVAPTGAASGAKSAAQVLYPNQAA